MRQYSSSLSNPVTSVKPECSLPCPQKPVSVPRRLQLQYEAKETIQVGGTVSWHDEDNSLKLLAALIWGYLNLLGDLLSTV